MGGVIYNNSKNKKIIYIIHKKQLSKEDLTALASGLASKLIGFDKRNDKKI